MSDVINKSLRKKIITEYDDKIQGSSINYNSKLNRANENFRFTINQRSFLGDISTILENLIINANKIQNILIDNGCKTLFDSSWEVDHLFEYYELLSDFNNAIDKFKRFSRKRVLKQGFNSAIYDLYYGIYHPIASKIKLDHDICTVKMLTDFFIIFALEAIEQNRGSIHPDVVNVLNAFDINELKYSYEVNEFLNAQDFQFSEDEREKKLMIYILCENIYLKGGIH